MFGFDTCTRCNRVRTQGLGISLKNVEGQTEVITLVVCARCRGLARYENDAARRRGAFSPKALEATPPWLR